MIVRVFGADGLDGHLVAPATDEEVADIEGEPGEGVENRKAKQAHAPAGFVFVVHGVALGTDDGEAFGFEDACDGGEIEAGDAIAGLLDFLGAAELDGEAGERGIGGFSERDGPGGNTAHFLEADGGVFEMVEAIVDIDEVDGLFSEREVFDVIGRYW